MKPIFCGNFEFECRASDLERLFRRYGKVDRVDMKNGFAFIYMDDERDADYAIRALDRTEFGRKGRRLRVEWTKHEQAGRKPVSSKRSANLRPSKTLFVINFPESTQTRDLERHFDPYGKINNVRIRKNFGFVEFECVDDAIKALDATNQSKMMDRVISVEYSARGDNNDNRKNGYSPDKRNRDRSPDRRRRSPSPYKRPRRSPDYGTGSSPLAKRRERGSPVYGNGSSRSPRRVERGSPVYNRKRSPSPRHVERGSLSPVYNRKRSPSPRRVERGSRSPVYNRKRSPSPGRGRGRSRSPPGEKNGNGYGRQPSLGASDVEEGAILDDEPEPARPIRKSESRDRPRGESRISVERDSPIRKSNSRDRPVEKSRSPLEKRYSSSPPARERSQS